MTVTEPVRAIANEPDDDYPTQFGTTRRHSKPVVPRVPPHDLAAEEAFLGAALTHAVKGGVAATPEAFAALQAVPSQAVKIGVDIGLDAADFYRPQHGFIWQAILDLYANGVTPDPITVADHLHRNGHLDQVGGPAALVELVTGTPAISNAARYAEIILEHSTLCQLIAVAAQAADLAHSLPDDVQAVTTRIVGLVTRVADRAAPDRDLFHPWTPAELLDADVTFSWLVKGMYATPTYGMTVGEMKTAKSTISGITAMSVAAGLPVLGKFHVDYASPVVLYVGEGGRIPHTRFLTRVARAIGLDDWRDVPIYPRYETAPLNTPRFQKTLERDLDTIRPGLVIIDPYYSFHGSEADARNLHDEASVLNAASAPIVEAGAVLDIVHHFNRNDGTGLKRITMAGGGEWVDTWRLLSHRNDPDVDNGRFYLRLELGSRQWGGTTWDIDLNLGRFNPELGIHDGDITWTIGRPDKNAATTEAADRILEIVTDTPLQHSREELAKLAGIAIKDARQLVDKLAREGRIVPQIVPQIDAIGRTQKTWRFDVPTDPQTDHDGPSQ